MIRKLILIMMLSVFMFSTYGFSENNKITVYSNNFAVISRQAGISLKKGTQTIVSPEVSDFIEPSSVNIFVPDNSFDMEEQLFRYDLSNSLSLLKKFIGSEVSLLIDEKESVEGRLLSANDDIILENPDKKLLVIKNSSIIRFDLPGGSGSVVSNPVLYWTINSKKEGNTGYMFSYVTNEIGWTADYNMILTNDEKQCDINSWATIDNRTSCSYKNAEIKLVAGDLKKASANEQIYGMGFMKSAARVPQADMAQESFQEKALFEYHSYDLGKVSDINSGEKKQISMISGKTVNVIKNFVYEPSRDQGKVLVAVEFENSKKQGLGLPLPGGTVKVYQRFGDAVNFIGEDRMENISVNETAKVSIGYAFDISAERNIMEERVISPRESEQVVEIKITNRKNEPVTVKVIEKIWRNWDITQTSQNYKKKNANTIEFLPSIPAGNESKITYTIRYKNKG